MAITLFDNAMTSPQSGDAMANTQTTETDGEYWPDRADLQLVAQLHNLRAFLAVTRAGSITAASKMLFKAASAVTRSVLELEQVLGHRVFERGARTIAINDYGAIVGRRATRIAAEIEQAVGDLARGRGRGSAPPARAVEQLLFNGRKLRLIVTLADAGVLSTAAERLGMTQSGASMALARFETAIGCGLFMRTHRNMVPNEAAERLVRSARRIFAELRHMHAELLTRAGPLAGTIVLGAPPMGRTSILPLALASALNDHPELHVSLLETAYDQLLQGLRNGDVDAVIGVARAEGEMRDLTIESLTHDRLTILARAGHALAGRRLTLSDLAGMRWILPRSGSPSRQIVDRCFAAERLAPPQPSVESADLAIIRQLLGASDMLAVTSARQMLFELQSGLLTELDIELPGFDREICLIVRQGGELSRSALAMLDIIRAQAAPPPAL